LYLLYGTYLLIPIVHTRYDRYLFIAAASVGMYHGGNLDLSLESIELETESRYEDKKSGDQIIGQ